MSHRVHRLLPVAAGTFPVRSAPRLPHASASGDAASARSDAYSASPGRMLGRRRRSAHSRSQTPSRPPSSGVRSFLHAEGEGHGHVVGQAAVGDAPTLEPEGVAPGHQIVAQGVDKQEMTEFFFIVEGIRHMQIVVSAEDDGFFQSCPERAGRFPGWAASGTAGNYPGFFVVFLWRNNQGNHLVLSGVRRA